MANTNEPAVDPTPIKRNLDGTPCKLVKRSKIWEIFRTVAEEPKKAICGKCDAVISRGGGSGKSQCTTNLWKHLENKHPESFAEASKYKEVINRAERVKRHHPENSKAWRLFSVAGDDPSVIKCSECDIEITCDPSESNATDALWYHIMTEHQSMYEKCVSEAMESAVSTQKGKRSLVWSEFTQHPMDFCKVICNTCDTVVSRGTTKESLNTTNMRRHLLSSSHLSAVRDRGGLELGRLPLDGETNITDIVSPKVRKLGIPSDHGNTDKIQNGSSLQINAMDAQTLLKQRPVDLFHTGLLGYALYEQQKRGVCCDFSIVVLNKNSLSFTDQERSSPEISSDEIKIHACVASVMSENFRKTIASGERQLKLADIRKPIVEHFVEIAYTGKLDVINAMGMNEVIEVYKVAKLLGADTVAAYVQRSYPNVSFQTGREQLNYAVNQNTSTQQSLSSAQKASDTGHEYSPPAPALPSSVPTANKRKNYMPKSNSSMK